MSEEQDDVKHYLYCLLPERFGTYGILIKLTKSAFINSTINGKWQDRINAYRSKVLSEEEEEKKLRKILGGDTQFNEERSHYYKFLEMDRRVKSR